MSRQRAARCAPLTQFQIVLDENSEGAIQGDVDMDGEVTISDVTCLIDYLLSGNASSINLDVADSNGDGEININDVTSLIDYLLMH